MSRETNTRVSRIEQGKNIAATRGHAKTYVNTGSLKEVFQFEHSEETVLAGEVLIGYDSSGQPIWKYAEHTFYFKAPETQLVVYDSNYLDVYPGEDNEN